MQQPQPPPPPTEGVDVAAAAGSGSGDPAESYEQQHVHGVYEEIAPHFSATRHRPWPRVARFLRAQPPGAVGLDVGCGNGKYLGVNPDVALLGSDRSAALVGLARGRAWETTATTAHAAGEKDGGVAAGSEAVAVADGLALPFRIGGRNRGRTGDGDGGRDRGVDFAICIAVLHHLSTRERRIEGVSAILECLRDGGTALVYVWALEQGSSRRGWDEGADQDRLVPWVMKAKAKPKPKGAPKKGVVAAAGVGDQEQPAAAAGGGSDGDKTYQRYYHLYKKGELEDDVAAAGGVVLESGYDQDNWWAIASRS
ncbi:tRNA methyltransferase, has a role in tRNA modification [Diatrype stigma]|uniref:tRNA methyltransferase, has a role in tRNA modification n=1 Tax=Diatrype stigma TaxID=117547 RepID=A0AAN9YSR7_9PEZI